MNFLRQFGQRIPGYTKHTWRGIGTGRDLPERSGSSTGSNPKMFLKIIYLKLCFPCKFSRSAFGCFSRDHDYLALSRNNCPFAEKKKNFMKAHAYCCLSRFAADTPTPSKRWRIHHADVERVARPSCRWALGRILYLWFVLKSSLLCPGAFSLWFDGYYLGPYPVHLIFLSLFITSFTFNFQY